MRFVWSWTAAVLFFSSWGVAQGEEVSPEARLGADDCAALAVEQNRLVRAARESAESARQAFKETGAQRLPRLTTSATYAKINDGATTTLGVEGATGSSGAGSLSGIEEATTASVSLVQPLADQIGLGHAAGIARLGATIAEFEQTAAENEAAFAARQAFYAVLTLEKTAESVEQTIAEFEETLKLVRSLKEGGRALQRDVNKADIALDQAKLGLIEAQNALQSARSALRDVLGLPLDAVITLEPTEAVEPFDLTLDACQATAAVQRPDLSASRLRHAAARRGIALARSAYIPSLGAALSYEWEDTDLTDSSDSVQIGLSWSWDVWDWGQRRAGVRGAEADERAARLYSEDAQSRVALEVERVWLAVALAKKTIEVAKKDWDYAVENVRVSRAQYEEGVLLVTDLLDDQTALNDARIAYYVAIYEYATALADLRRAIGER